MKVRHGHVREESPPGQRHRAGLPHLDRGPVAVAGTPTGGAVGFLTGDNTYAQVLGDGVTDRATVPQQVGADMRWTNVAVGYAFTVAIRSDGTLWAWGCNSSGQVGDHSTTERHTPVQLGTATNWAAVAAGYAHAVALRTDGTLWAWGANGNGQLGDGTTTEHHAPERIGTATSWASVAAGDFFTVAVRTNGTLWAWGANAYSQLGDGSTLERHDPEQIGSADTWATAAAGSRHTVAVRTDGALWAWGFNHSGQLGDGTRITRRTPVRIRGVTWARIAAGTDYTVAVLTDGTLWAWGDNSFGQLGDGTNTGRIKPEQIGVATTWASVSAGDHDTVGVRTDGTLYGPGGQRGRAARRRHHHHPHHPGTDRHRDELGHGSRRGAAYGCDTHRRHALGLGGQHLGRAGTGYTQRVTSFTAAVGRWSELAVGSGYTIGVRANGALWAWGSNADGQLGDGTTIDRTIPEQIGTATNWATVVAGAGHTVAVRTDGTLWAWGCNAYGQLGDGTTTTRTSPEQIGTATNWASVAVGVLAHGRDAHRRHAVGLGLQRQRAARRRHHDRSPPAGADRHLRELGALLAAGGNHTVAVRTDGTLWAWGDNGYGAARRRHDHEPQYAGADRHCAGLGNCQRGLRSHGRAAHRRHVVGVG